MADSIWGLCEWLAGLTGYDARYLFGVAQSYICDAGLTLGEFVDCTLSRDW